MIPINPFNEIAICKVDSIVCLNAEQVRQFTPVNEAITLAVLVFILGMIWGYILYWLSHRGKNGDS